MPDVLYEEVVEVEERVVLKKNNCMLNTQCPVEKASTGEEVATDLSLLLLSF